MVALDESPSPRLIVAASHTALSGDLGVLIIELPGAYRATTPAGPPPTVRATEDASAELEDDDDEDYSIESGQIPVREPLVLRLV